MLRVPSLTAFVACALFFASRPARAVDDLLTPRAVAMGNSLRADATGALGPLLNPAGMAMRKSYSLEAMYGFRVQDTGSNLLASVVDSVTSRVAAGVYYSYVHGSRHLYLDGFGPVTAVRDGNEAGMALALPLGDKFAFGLTTKYSRVSTVIDPANNPGLVLATPIVLDSTTSTATAAGFTIDAGIAFRLGESFHVGIVGYNLIPLRSFESPISLGTGLAYKLGTVFTLSYDLVVDFNKYKSRIPDKSGMAGADLTTVRTGGGFEWLIKNKVALRGGAFWDQGRPAWYASGGLAYVGQTFAIDLAYKQQVSGGAESLIVAGLRVFLE